MSERFAWWKFLVLFLAIGFVSLLNFWIHPAISLKFGSSILIIALYVGIIGGAISLFFSNGDFEETTVISLAVFIGFMCIALIFIGIGAIFGSAIFTTNIRATQLGEVVEKDFTDDFDEIDLSQLPIVDAGLARNKADQQMEMNLGNMTNIGTFNEQSYKGKLVLVAPLEHAGWLKYKNNKSGTPGYVIVSSTNSSDVKTVTDIDGKSVAIKYYYDGIFGSNLQRHLRRSGYRSTGLTDYSFELDDDGFPYWVVTKYENMVIFDCAEATGILVVSATTGKITEYDLGEEPEWIDTIQPLDIIDAQIGRMGNLVNGLINWTQIDEYKTTPGWKKVYNATDGNCYYFTGLTSKGKDTTMSGFMLINTKTKAVVRYNLKGIDENTATKNIKARLKGTYSSTEFKVGVPLPLNVNGHETYFSVAKVSDSNEISHYAFINIKNGSILGVGKNKLEAYNNYINELSTNGNSVVPGSDSYFYEFTGIIDIIGSEVQDGNTVYKFRVVGKDLTFMAPYSKSDELIFTKEGQEVKITYIDSGNLDASIQTFDNLVYTNTRKSDDQIKKEEYDASVEEEVREVTEVDEEANQKAWEDLSEEEKADLLKEIENQKE